MLAALHAVRGLPEGPHELPELAAYAERTGDVLMLIGAHGWMGELELLLGRPEAALDHFEMILAGQACTGDARQGEHPGTRQAGHGLTPSQFYYNVYIFELIRRSYSYRMTSDSLSLHIEAAPGYELLMSLAVVSDTAARQTYELDPAWFDTARSSASPDLLARVEAWSGSDMVWAHLISLAYESPPPRDVHSFLAHLKQTDAVEIRLRLLGYYVRSLRRLTPPDVIAAAAAGDRRAQEEFLRTSYPGDVGWQTALRAVLPFHAQETKGRVLEILSGWYDQVFRAQEGRLMPILERDAESKLALLRSASPQKVLEVALPGYDYLPEPGLHRVLLIPSFVVRPQIHSFDHTDTKIFVYGVADESVAAESDAPPPRLLRLTKALGDERRLRILRRLSAGDFTLHELAVHFALSDTTMLHHLIILRSAGLVRVQPGSGKRYHLERQLLPEVGNSLETYLGAAAIDS